MRAVLVRNESGQVVRGFEVALEDGDFLVTDLYQLERTDVDQVREFIILDHDGRGPRHGQMVQGWQPLTRLGFTGAWRGQLVLDAGIKYREQHWKRAGLDG